MLFLILMGILALIGTILLTVGLSKKSDGPLIFGVGLLCGVILGAVVGLSVFMIDKNINVERYKSTVYALEETKLLLSSEGLSIGGGLEAQQLRQRLVDLIEKKADLKADLNWRRRSLWIPIKPCEVPALKAEAKKDFADQLEEVG